MTPEEFIAKFKGKIIYNPEWGTRNRFLLCADYKFTRDPTIIRLWVQFHDIKQPDSIDVPIKCLSDFVEYGKVEIKSHMPEWF